MRRQEAILWLGALVLFGCSGRLPDGKFTCAAASDCPSGQGFTHCHSNGLERAQRLCYRSSPPDAGEERDSTEADPSRSERVDGGGGRGGTTAKLGTSEAGASSERADADTDAGPDPAAAGSGGGPALDDGVFRITNPAMSQVTEPASPIVITFSRPVDNKTVTYGDAGTCFMIARPEHSAESPLDWQSWGGARERSGADVRIEPGDDERSIKLVPKQRWRLSTTYEVELTDGVLSRTRERLSKTRLTFRVRDGVWTQEHIQTQAGGEVYYWPEVAANSGGEVVVSHNWRASEGGRFAGRRGWRRRGPEDWATITEMESGCPDSGLLIFDSGTLVFTHECGSKLHCLDRGGQQTTARIEEQPSTTQKFVSGLMIDQPGDRIAVMVGSAYVATSCDPMGAFSSYAVPALSEATTDFRSSSNRVVWTEPQATTSDAGSALSALWGTSVGCSGEPSSCRTQLSRAMVDADEAVLSSEAVAWRETETNGSAIWARVQTEPSTWGDASQVSALGAVEQPSVGTPVDARVPMVWREHMGTQQRVMGSSFADGRWATPTQLSDAMPVTPHIETLALRSDPTGNAVLIWAQPTAAEESWSEVRARAFSARDGWQPDSTLLSHARVAADDMSLTMTDDGRAYVTFLETQNLWLARYE